MADVRPFLANVLRGRRVPAERVEEVAQRSLGVSAEAILEKLVSDCRILRGLTQFGCAR